MTETMACRGPDAAGTWFDTHAALGHRRLAIIDLPGGSQPMATESDAGKAAMVYSGETYNFSELRDELRRRGHRFNTDSDTEVVLTGYLEWGEAVAEKLNGMFAFAIWDTERQKLVMIRDRMGIKPLYYYPTADGVLFGSEPKAILENPLAERAVTLDGLREMFSFVKTPGHAVWEGMREVEPGTVVTVTTSGVKETRYWTLETKPHPDDQDSSVAHVRELLDDITERQLVADVPRCLLLSGGLDSSVLTGLAADQLAQHGETVRSFAVDFAGQSDNFIPDDLRGTPDGPFVHDVADLARTDHQDIVLSSAELADPEVRATVIRARDLPMGLGDMDSSLYLLFREIRKHSTVALSGESADEVFGGYKWFFNDEARKGETFPWMAQFSSMESGMASIFNSRLFEQLDLGGYVRNSYSDAVAQIERLDGESEHEYQMRKICYLHLTRFVRVLLDRKDRASMATGLEVRVPFCDHRLVEYVYNTPWSMKTFDGREKSLLRAAAADVLPKSVADRVKSPYPSTQDPAYAVQLQENARRYVADPSHQLFELIDHDWLAGAVTEQSDKVSQGSRFGLERALDLGLWFDMYKPTIKLG
ncbi:asparagine synthase (glutamine-hydrolyzing) [Spelaeicoccus albus]|uniref:asparagine synthase (glutamine-hydrolyzing) n=2 Tax=Spelaeicoccus albus TaxID=1280376 RepID=A0A7Z0A901_9MICO|nr:asparagine synthase (glutamine-hydrolyzing) [Spelaeicoccus albus]